MAAAEALLGAGADARARQRAPTPRTSPRRVASARCWNFCSRAAATRAPRTETSRRSRTSRRVAARCGAETAALACAPLRTGKGGLESWDAWRRTPRTGPWRTARPTGAARLGDAGARVRARTTSRVASAATATRLVDKLATRSASGRRRRRRTVLAALVAETRRFSVSTRAKADEALEDTELLLDQKSGIRDDVPERSTRAIEAEIVAAGRAAAT